VASSPNDIHGSIDCGPVQIAFRILLKRLGELSSQQSEEYRLKDVFGILGIARYAKCGAKDKGVVLLEESFEFPRQRPEVPLESRHCGHVLLGVYTLQYQIC
jgi:hypothetical protein